VKIDWAPFAIQDRVAIFDYIEADNPRSAVSIDERIRTQVETLAHFSEIGRAGRVAGTRELVISSTPYIAVYRIVADTVRILRILHGARQWPDEFPDQPDPG
jgi:toxin ParE1/3/4